MYKHLTYLLAYLLTHSLSYKRHVRVGDRPGDRLTWFVDTIVTTVYGLWRWWVLRIDVTWGRSPVDVDGVWKSKSYFLSNARPGLWS